MVTSLGKLIEDAADYLELAAGENDEHAIADAEAQVLALEPKLRTAELSRMLSGPPDRANALVSIHPRAGGTCARGAVPAIRPAWRAAVYESGSHR